MYSRKYGLSRCGSLDLKIGGGTKIGHGIFKTTKLKARLGN